MHDVTRPELTAFPDRFKKLPISRGYPVPWFVEWIDGKPEFRVADGRKRVQAVKLHLCWICGQRLGTKIVFVVGPMCAINRISSDPGMHLDCALWSVKNCPFLTRPHMVRREAGLPESTTVDGNMIERNPGVTLMWTCKDYKPFSTHDGEGGWLIKLGLPRAIQFYREGREATEAEVLESINSGFHALLDPAVEEGPKAMWDLKEAVIEAETYLNLRDKLKPLVDHIRPVPSYR